MPSSVVKEEISTRFKCELYYEFIKGGSYITLRPNINANSFNELRAEIKKTILRLTDVKEGTMKITTIEEIWVGARKKQEILNYYYSIQEFEEDY